MDNAGDRTAHRRSLELLWTGPSVPARGPRRALDIDRIVAVAIEIADADGLSALSMRRVANELGVGTASLYGYLPGKAELHALMLDALAGESVLPHQVPGDWRAKFERCARDDWQGFRERPWVLQLASSDLAPGPNLLRWLDSGLLALDGTGLTEQEKMAIVESIDAYVRGLARLHLEPPGSEAGGDAAGQRERDEALGTLVDFSTYPALNAALRAGVTPYSGDQFEFGLQRLLDGVETLIVTRRETPT